MMPLFLCNNKVLPPSSNIWIAIINENNLTITTKNLYTRALTFFKSIKSKEIAEEIHETQLNSSSEDDSTSDEYENETNLEDIQEAEFHFKIFINHTEWEKITPIPKEYRNKNGISKTYLKFPSRSWTTVFCNEIWCTSKLPCAWSFKSHFLCLNKTSEYYLTTKGYCKECNSTVTCYSKNNELNIPEINGIVINCYVIGKPNITNHNKKRPLIGLSRKEISKEMVEKNKAACVTRRNLYGSLTDLFDKDPPTVPSLDVLRKAKSEIRNSNILHEDPVKSLELMAQRNPMQYVIHEIGSYKFFIHYWSPDQLRVYNIYCEKEKYPKVCIDATGKVVRKLKRIEGALSGHIFLYVIVISLPQEHEGQISICQMLSERHNSNCINYWLNEWRRLGAKNPKEAVCDFSIALISAMCRAFANCADMNCYIGECIKVLMNENGAKLPACFIRVDVAHLIKSVTRWKEIHSSTTKRRKIRQFYIRAVGQLILATNFEEIKSLIFSIFVSALSQTEGHINEDSRPTLCEIEKKQTIK